ncbi:class F sortase [Nocardioides antri]|uniref:Class F sortase n=1 Tax=Nocardioides antri TaxID=2607659 RepID=A0A5B1M411_9ACTN|nr:class F sortase [Nocardioides antri]KAA1426507.1 class F sortase [Nocardioides antri]
MSRRTRWIAAAIAAAVVVACVLGWWLLRSDADPAPEAEPPPASAAPTVTPGPALAPDRCQRPTRRPFTPERISIDGVVEDAAVIGVPRDSRGVTGVLPEDNKVDVAWDLGGIRPGDDRGNVLLNTHTWPDGSALGNAMLDELRKGDLIVLHGRDGRLLCYQVARRLEVLAADGYKPYYGTDGPPRIAFIVCSGTRSSAGEWSHRTIWFALPIG